MHHKIIQILDALFEKCKCILQRLSEKFMSEKEEKGKTEEIAEKTGEVVGKGLKKGLE